MKSIQKTTQAGTLESGDIMITVAPGANGSGVVIDLQSIVLAQYGEAIRQTLTDIVTRLGIGDIYIKAIDRGALECTIRARLLAALNRGGILTEGEHV